jgi:hypothetical protein
VSVPEYDEQAARSVEDWADVPGAPDVLHDVPTRCVFCGEFVQIAEIDPVLVVATSWRRTAPAWLYAAHASCLDEFGDKSGTR